MGPLSCLIPARLDVVLAAETVQSPPPNDKPSIPLRSAHPSSVSSSVRPGKIASMLPILEAAIATSMMSIFWGTDGSYDLSASPVT
jgi:hypothetical protein